MKNNNLTIGIIVAVVAVFVISLLTSPMVGYSNYEMMGMMGAGFGFMWLFGTLFMILVFVALVLLVIWLIKQLSKKW